MMKIADVVSWLLTQDQDHHFGVDDGGLTLEVPETNAYLEIGGLQEYLLVYACGECGSEWSRLTKYVRDDNCIVCRAVSSPVEVVEL